MIYIDPPYNTGNDFVYADDFADPMARYKEITQQTTKSNPETMGRFHTNWLNMMYPRLRLAANLLRDDGVIFISIDDNEVDNLKKLCNEVFGEENFITCIVWQKIHSTKNDAKYLSDNHEYLLVYAKQRENIHINLLPRTSAMNERYKNPDNDPRGPWQSGDLVASGERSNGHYNVVSPISGKVFDVPQGKHWVYSEDNMKTLLAENRLWFGPDGTAFPRKKRFLSEVQDGRTANTLWLSEEVGHNQSAAREVKALFDDNKYFDFPKPVDFVKQMLQLSTTDNDIVLDFFSGSATTAHAVMQLNAEDEGHRRFILVQLPEVCDENSEAYKAGYKNICEIGKERIRRAGKKLSEADGQMQIEDSEKKPLDVGFRVFKLDTSNLQTWDTTPIQHEQMEILIDRMNGMVQRVKSDRSDMDMVCEVMLKLGVPLTCSVAKIDINGKSSYTVGEDCLLLICLAANVSPEDVETMAEYVPAKMIISRDSFANDTAMANAYYILRDRGIELKLV